MNEFHIQSHSTDENDKNESIEFPRKYYIGCMPYYVCPFCYSFRSIDYKSNEEPLSGMSRYIIFSFTLMFVKFGHYFY